MRKSKTEKKVEQFKKKNQNGLKDKTIRQIQKSKRFTSKYSS